MISWDDWWRESASVFDEAEVNTFAGGARLPQVLSRGGGSEEGGCPTADTWDNGSLEDVLEDKRDHTAVWTGTEMILWGGVQLNNNSDTGFIYDPATDDWTREPRPRRMRPEATEDTSASPGARRISGAGPAP